MKNCFLLATLLSLASGPIWSQGYNPVGARSNALSNASVTLDDVWAYHHNPGATASIKSFSAGVYYETRFLSKELQTQALAVAIPLKKGVITTGAQFFGYEQYRQSRFGVGYAMQLTERFAAGVQLNGQQLRLGNNYGATFNGTVEAGLIAKISEKWRLGASVMNIGRQRISTLEDRYSTVMRIGCQYLPSKRVLVLAEVEKDVMHPIAFKGAVEYQPLDVLFIRLGAQSGPTHFSFGFGYRKKGFAIDLGTKYHQVLGWSPMIGLNYQLEKHAE